MLHWLESPPKTKIKCNSPPKTKINISKKTEYKINDFSNAKAQNLPQKRKNFVKKTKAVKKDKSSQKEKIISIHHINSRGTVGKIEEVFQYTEENDPDILLISETKLDESVSNTFVEPPGYKIIRKDRSENFKKKYNMTGLGGWYCCTI